MPQICHELISIALLKRTGSWGTSTLEVVLSGIRAEPGDFCKQWWRWETVETLERSQWLQKSLPGNSSLWGWTDSRIEPERSAHQSEEKENVISKVGVPRLHNSPSPAAHGCSLPWRVTLDKQYPLCWKTWEFSPSFTPGEVPRPHGMATVIEMPNAPHTHTLRWEKPVVPFLLQGSIWVQVRLVSRWPAPWPSYFSCPHFILGSWRAFPQQITFTRIPMSGYASSKLDPREQMSKMLSPQPYLKEELSSGEQEPNFWAP